MINEDEDEASRTWETLIWIYMAELLARWTQQWMATPVRNWYPAHEAISINNNSHDSWWRHQMETFSALLAICAGNSPVTDEFPTQRPVTRSFDVFFDLRMNKRLS